MIERLEIYDGADTFDGAPKMSASAIWQDGKIVWLTGTKREIEGNEAQHIFNYDEVNEIGIENCKRYTIKDGKKFFNALGTMRGSRGWSKIVKEK